MSRKIMMFGVCFLFLGFSLWAQSPGEVLKFSYLSPLGATARTMGVGGSIGALGGDMSAISSNPAGLATYRTNEFTFSLGGGFSKSTANLVNDPNSVAFSQNVSKVTFDNIGYISANVLNGDSKWRTTNIGIVYNKIADYRQNFYYEGHSAGSFVQRLRDQANSTGLDAFESELGDSTGAIYKTSTSGGKYLSDYDGLSVPIKRSQSVDRKGSLSEIAFGLAANYDDFFSIGAAIGIPLMSFTENKSYTETNDLNNVPSFKTLNYKEYNNIDATGFNLKVGAILRPAKWLRLGLAVHTPTAFSATNNYNANMTYAYKDNGTDYNFNSKSPDGNFSYTLYSPWRVIGSAGVVLGKKGFLTAEVERVGYSGASYEYDSQYVGEQNAINKEVDNLFRSVVYVRLGGEYVAGVFRFRGGFGMNPSPLASANFTNYYWTAGVGVREAKWFLDLAYRNEAASENYSPYQYSTALGGTSFQQGVKSKYGNNNIVMTLGFKFGN
jgi:hypothetical protein